MVAIALDGHLDIRSIRRRNLGLRHKERGPNLALKQRIQPAPLLFLIAVLGQHLHIARIRGGAVGRLRGSAALAEILSHEAVLQVREAGALLEVVLGQEHVPEAELAGARLEVLDDGGVRLEALLGGLADLARVDGVGGDAFFLDESLDLWGC